MKAEINLATPTDFSWPECYRFLSRSTQESTHKCQEGSIYKLFTSGKVAKITGHSQGRLTVEWTNGRPSTSEALEAVKFVTEWFDLERDLHPFYRIAHSDPLLNPLVQAYRGLRLIGVPDLFEALSWAIIGQQINLNFAFSLKKRLVERFGQSAQEGPVHIYRFPSPRRIASLTVEELLPMQFSRRKAEYLIGIARLIDQGRLSKEDMMRMEFAEAKQQLESIRGIGSWTANYVLMKSLGHTDAFPVKDVGLHNAVKKRLNWQRKPTLEELNSLAKAWVGWRGYATFFLWHSLLDH